MMCCWCMELQQIVIQAIKTVFWFLWFASVWSTGTLRIPRSPAPQLSTPTPGSASSLSACQTPRSMLSSSNLPNPWAAAGAQQFFSCTYRSQWGLCCGGGFRGLWCFRQWWWTGVWVRPGTRAVWWWGGSWWARFWSRDDRPHLSKWRSTWSEWEFPAESAVLDLVDLLVVGFGVVEHHSVALFECLTFELSELEIHLEQLGLVVGGDDHAALLLRADGDGDAASAGE